MRNVDRSVKLLREGYGLGETSVVDEVVATDVIDHSALPGAPSGPAGVKEMIRLVRCAFPDVIFSIVHALEDGDYVVLHWNAVGTHLGEFLGGAPTGRSIQMSGIEIDRFVDGRIAEIWEERDMFGLMVQLGLVPAP